MKMYLQPKIITEVMNLSRPVYTTTMDDYNMIMNFPQFLERKFLEWQSNEGQRKTLDQFASYIGVSQPLLSQWMNGKRRPGSQNIEFLAELFGPEIYDALGIPRPNPIHLYVTKHWDDVPLEEQQRIGEIVARYTTETPPKHLEKQPAEN